MSQTQPLQSPQQPAPRSASLPRHPYLDSGTKYPYILISIAVLLAAISWIALIVAHLDTDEDSINHSLMVDTTKNDYHYDHHKDREFYVIHDDDITHLEEKLEHECKRIPDHILRYSEGQLDGK